MIRAATTGTDGAASTTTMLRDAATSFWRALARVEA